MTRLKIQDIREGDIFYESSQAVTAKFLASQDPHSDEIDIQGRVHTRWHLKALHEVSNTIQHFTVTEGFEHYGPSLYTQPAYVVTTSQGFSYPPLS